MIERLVEDWLASATERSLQTPFCHTLASKGMTVLHLTRHGEMELGKDVIAVDSEGTPHVYQLKTPTGPRITIREWRKQVSTQVHDLVTTAVVHPSLGKSRPHRSFLVTNKEIDEPVMRAIHDMNCRWEDAGFGHLKLDTIVRGQLLRDFIDLGTNLWPSELTRSKELIELFLQDGREPFDAAKLCGLLEATLPFYSARRPAQSLCRRALSSAGLLAAVAASQHTRTENHVAQVEAWTLYCCYVLALAEKWSLPQSVWMPSITIARSSIRNTLRDLVEELRERKNLIEGDPFNDNPFRRVRITRLVGLVSIFALWRRSDGGDDPVDESAEKFCEEHRRNLWLWGEGAVPLLLAFYWFWRKRDPTPAIDHFLSALISGICRANGPESNPRAAIPSPYYSESDVLAARLGLAEKPIEEDFRKHSYCLESLVHLFVRLNWKAEVGFLWPSITHIWFTRFAPEAKWQFFQWRVRNGLNWHVALRCPQDWSELRVEAAECDGASIPTVIRDDPVLLALILCVLPHRLTADVARWLDTRLEGS